MASFVGATAYTQNRLARLDEVSSTIETDAVPSIDYLSRVAVRLTKLNQSLDGVAAGGPQAVSAREAARIELDGLEADVAAYLGLPPLPGEEAHWAALRADAEHAVQATRQVIEATGVPSPQTFDAVGDALDAALRSVAATLAFDIRQSKAMARDLRAVRAETLGMVVKLDGGSSLVALIAAIVAYRASRRHDEVLQERNALLNDRVRELDRFAGRVAHDILSPLGTIATALPLLERGADPKTADYVERSRRAVGRVKQLVEALLAFARSGAHPDPAARCAVEPVLRAVTVDCTQTAEAHAITLQMEAAPALEARCSAGALTSIVQNLVRNAIVYMGEETTRHVEVRASKDGNVCRIAVEDSGPGIPPESVGTIFEPFVRGPQEKVPGTGLGLATVKRLVESHGGTITVRSDVGRGTVFTVDLPNADA
ncbi:MAG TPA: HAMP domain-containing sensor histidine kinase [Vicinamibacterales bacterium]|nr:HAMP domain-containing sensor histidine kinase [Vicinamibacterales bacterium]